MKNLLKNREKSLNTALAVILIFLIIALSVFPDVYSKVTLSGILLWATAVLPSLLPYFFLTALLTKINVLSEFCNALSPIAKKPFRLGGSAVYAFLTSVLSGYPVGSKIIADLYGEDMISIGEATRMSVLCSTSGPLFIIGAVGSAMFKSKTIGFILYITHVLSAILTALIFRNVGGDKKDYSPKTYACKDDNALYNAVYSSVISVLIVGGFVSVFFVISEILVDFKILYPLSLFLSSIFSGIGGSIAEGTAVSVGIIEFTKGCQLLSNIGATPLPVSLACFLITFGGLSAILQSLTFLVKAKVSAKFFILGKLTQGVIAGVLCYFTCLIFL
ncbi:MAG: hypothetical protein J6V66_01125 [Clostridia bacterium]|nr:hypothetical protein [Clostridia bacterium]